MASPAWLPPGFSPSASQPPVSISSSGVPSGGPSNPTAVFPALSGCTPASQSSSLTTNNSVQESLQTKTGFSYSSSQSANITSGTTQQSSSNAVVVSNPSTSSMVLQPPIPGMHSSTSHSFSYNISQSGSMFPGSQQFQTSMNVSGGIAHETIASSAPTTTPSISVVSQTSNFPMMSSTPNSGPSASWAPAGLAFLNPGAPRAPGTPGPPGIVQSAQLSSNFSGPSVAANSSSTIMRPGMPAGNVASNSSVPAHVRAPHPSLPAVAAPSQGFWLQPMHMGGMHRLPVLPYPATFASPFPLMAGGMPPPSTAVPGSHPPGVISVVNTGAIPASSAASVHQLSGPSGMTMELPASDHKLSVHDVCLQDGDAVNEQLDAWTAHKTETGVVYYYNSLTGESTYNKPLGLKGELEKVSAQPKPVSMVNVAGTDWVLVTTTDGKKYYYDSKTKVSSWQIPNEVTELRKKQDAENLKENATSVPNSNLVADKEAASISLNVPAFSTGGRDAMALRASGMQSSALDLVKKKLQDSGAPVASSPVQVPSAMTASEVNGSKALEATSKGHPNESSKDKPNDTNGDGNVSDSSSDSEDTDSGSMKEECIIQFKEMLKERGVAPFSKWDKELPKFVFDPRFKAIPSHSTRRALFEHYVKTRMEEERKEKRAAQRAAIEGFKQLLDEASEDIDHKTDYQTFRKKWGNDPCFLALDRKDRENLLKERILPLKKAAEEKAQAIRAAAVSSFKSMLREKEDITVTSRWPRVKDSLRNDPRYKSVNHEDREVLFNEHLSELRATEEEAEQEAKAKRQEQDKLKERERELRKRKEREEQEMERVRLKVRRKEVIASFQALLVETIKDPQASWTESKAKLEKDPQGRASNSDLDSSEVEKLFRDHIRTLLERCAREYRALLAEVLTAAAAAQETEGGKTVLSSWSTAKRLLKPDPRYNKMPRKEREVLWRRYAEDMLRKQNLEVDNRGDKKLDLKSRSSADPGRSSSGLRR